MSAAYAPEPDDRRGEPAPSGELSTRDHRILDEIAGYENGSDPSFVARLREQPSRPASPLTNRVVQVLAVVAVAALLLPTAWLMVGIVLTVLFGVPVLLAWHEHRERRRRSGPTAPAGPDPAS